MSAQLELDYLHDIGSLALGSRLKRLSDRLANEVSKIYQLRKIDFEPRWFPIFRYIAEAGSASITEIATAVGVTHPAVNQIAKELADKNLVLASSGKSDKRVRMLSLSSKGKKTYEELKTAWRSIHASVADALSESEINLMRSIQNFENALDRRDLLSRYDEVQKLMTTEEVRIVSYSEELADQFVRLNRAWIEKYFAVEAADEKLFRSPRQIIEDGGEIFFAQLGSKTIGTCALLKKNDYEYELGKMGVDEAFQGTGAGRKLLQHCIDHAKKNGFEKISLETNTKLKAAIKMYEKFGFLPVKPKDNSHYSRVDLAMELHLQRR